MVDRPLLCDWIDIPARSATKNGSESHQAKKLVEVGRP